MSMAILALLHICILAFSNVLVQYPFTIFGLHTTWGAFSYPLIFVVTDLIVRILGARAARKVVLVAMIPGLLISYVLSNLFASDTLSWSQAWLINGVALRIALASFTAYVLGQFLDIMVFVRVRQHYRWWVAPTLSSIFGNLFDTFCFFFVAFYHSSNHYMRVHWLEIATVDLGFKLLISVLSFVPIYGIFLGILERRSPRYLTTA